MTQRPDIEAIEARARNMSVALAAGVRLDAERMLDLCSYVKHLEEQLLRMTEVAIARATPETVAKERAEAIEQAERRVVERIERELQESIKGTLDEAEANKSTVFVSTVLRIVRGEKDPAQ